jgi:hypothetical protein
MWAARGRTGVRIASAHPVALAFGIANWIYVTIAVTLGIANWRWISMATAHNRTILVAFARSDVTFINWRFLSKANHTDFGTIPVGQNNPPFLNKILVIRDDIYFFDIRKLNYAVGQPSNELFVDPVGNLTAIGIRGIEITIGISKTFYGTVPCTMVS